MTVETKNPKAMSLYVIDDHPLMREAVVMLLRRLRPGSTVVELDRIGGVESAVKQHGTPDLICLDLKLPDTTGTSGIHELKKRFRKHRSRYCLLRRRPTPKSNASRPARTSTSKNPRVRRKSATHYARC